MNDFRKKPVVIQAVQLTDNQLDTQPHPDHIVGVVYDPVKRCALIRTLEGVMTASVGDWIIKGIKGEYYPCKPDIFEATYEEVVPELTEAKTREMPSTATIMGIEVLVDTSAHPSSIVVSPAVMTKMLDWATSVQKVQADTAEKIRQETEKAQK